MANQMKQTNLQNESAEYLAKRDELRLAEIELMRQRERVAQLRRQLPEGAIVQDYVFEEGPAKREGRSTASKKVLSRHARSASAKRSAASRSRSARKAAATRKK